MNTNLRGLPQGQMLSDYRIEGVLGQGGFGITYLATDTMLNRRVAVKEFYPRLFAVRDGTLTIRPSGSQEDRDTFKWGLERFLEEAQVLARFDEPNIIGIRRFFKANGTAYLVMDYCDGEPLDEVIKRKGPLSPTQIDEILYPLLDGLEKIHEANFLHRDIKPANIFIAADGSLKLGDLGLGRFFSSQTYEAFSRVGTPLYMSPEVLSGNGYDWKSDVWSMGCIAYELATLRSPFKADDAKMSLYELFQTISKGEYPAIESRYSEELRSLIDMMLRLKPAERYDAEQVLKVCMQKKELVLTRPKIDPFLVMDDILEKLRLLNYETEFCKRFNRKPISRIFFSHEEDPEHIKFTYFYELCYWLMSFSKKRTKLIGGITEFNPDLNDDSKLKQLLLDLSTFGVKLPENVNTKQTSNVFYIFLFLGSRRNSLLCDQRSCKQRTY